MRVETSTKGKSKKLILNHTDNSINIINTRNRMKA